MTSLWVRMDLREAVEKFKLKMSVIKTGWAAMPALFCVWHISSIIAANLKADFPKTIFTKYYQYTGTDQRWKMFFTIPRYSRLYFYISYDKKPYQEIVPERLSVQKGLLTMFVKPHLMERWKDVACQGHSYVGFKMIGTNIITKKINFITREYYTCPLP